MIANLRLYRTTFDGTLRISCPACGEILWRPGDVWNLDNIAKHVGEHEELENPFHAEYRPISFGG